MIEQLLKKLTGLKSSTNKPIKPVLIVLALISIGILTVSFSRANTISVSIEPESDSNQQEKVLVEPGSDSSKGSHVKFSSSVPCSPLETVGCTSANSSGIYFKESFNLNPPSPVSAMNNENLLPRWYAQPTMENSNGFALSPEPMLAQHDANCGRPETWKGTAWDGFTIPQGFRKISTYEESVFMCKDHIMTAINPPSTGTANGAVVLKPNHMVDLSKINSGEIPEAIIRVDVSTLSSSDGDWWDIWLSSWDEQVIAPADHGHHQVGPPRDNSLRLPVVTFGTEKKFWAHAFWEEGNLKSGFTSAFIDENAAINIRPFLNISDTRRDLYEVHITKDKVKLVLKHAETGEIKIVGEHIMPYQGFLGNEAVVQFVHANYEPEKNGKVGGETERKIPSTWHWDNVEIYPAKEYDLIGTKQYLVYSASPSKKVTFNRAAPKNARMLFSALTFESWGPMEVSFDNGATYNRAEIVKEGAGNGPHPDVSTLKTYTIDVPENTTELTIRGRNGIWPGTTDGPCNPAVDCWGAFNFHVIAKK